MTVTLSLFAGAGAQFFDSNGVILSGGKLYTYAAGTTTPLACYTSLAGNIPHSNPIILDSAARVPGGEIWLSTGVGYKFALYTAMGVLVATYDNIPSAAAPPAANDADSIMYEQGCTIAAGQFKVGSVYRIATVGTTDFTLIGAASNAVGLHFVATGAGTGTGTAELSNTVEGKLQQYVAAKDFGAVGNGVADDTAALTAAFDYAIPLALPVELEGTYLVSGPIQPYASRASGSVHIVCKGHVIINVSGSATAFRDLFYHETTASNNCSIIGGSLTVDCNNKAASGLTFRHLAASQSGVVNISCPVEVLNCYNNDAAATYENQGIAVIGDYETVVIERPRVVGVSRASVNGACKGISVSGFSGVVTINQPYAANILTGAGTVDADGIATFGKILGTTYNARGGVANINEPVFVDCQGRSFKSQCSDTTVFRPRVFRKDVVSITNSVEFDFQFGGQALVIEPYYEYRLNGATNPIGSSHSCIFWNQQVDDMQNVGKSTGGVLRTEVLVPRYAGTQYRAGAYASHVEVDGLDVVPIGALTTKAISRAIIEFRGDQVGAKSTTSTFVVRNCRGPMNTYAVCYTDYDGSVLTSKLSFEITDNYNTLTSGTLYAAFGNISGAVILNVEKFIIRNNYGYKSLMPAGWTFDFNSLAPGNLFTVDIATVSATNAPGWGVSGYAFIESLDQWFNTNDQHIRVTVNNAAVANTVFFTQGGATPTWGTIK